MRKLLLIGVFMIAWSAVTVLVVTYGAFYNWPDNVHTDYGLPMTWATHTTSTLIGAANIWSVDIGALTIDLAVWLIIMIVAVAVIQILLSRRNRS